MAIRSPATIGSSRHLKAYFERNDDIFPAFRVISNRTGRPYKEDHFRHVFAEVRESVAYEIPCFYDPAGGGVVQTADLQFIDLRRTAVVHLGRAGATVPEIAALTGHSETTVHELLRVYLPRDRAVADAAITKLEAYRERR